MGASVRGAHRLLQTPDLTTREGPTDQTPTWPAVWTETEVLFCAQRRTQEHGNVDKALESENTGKVRVSYVSRHAVHTRYRTVLYCVPTVLCPGTLQATPRRTCTVTFVSASQPDRVHCKKLIHNDTNLHPAATARLHSVAGNFSFWLTYIHTYIYTNNLQQQSRCRSCLRIKFELSILKIKIAHCSYVKARYFNTSLTSAGFNL